VQDKECGKTDRRFFWAVLDGIIQKRKEAYVTARSRLAIHRVLVNVSS
jgi:hypothetical protein